MHATGLANGAAPRYVVPTLSMKLGGHRENLAITRQKLAKLAVLRSSAIVAHAGA